MARLSKLKPGQIVYDVRNRRMGNTMMRHKDVFEVRIIEVFEDYVLASWNKNPARMYYGTSMNGWKVKRPDVPA